MGGAKTSIRIPTLRELLKQVGAHRDMRGVTICEGWPGLAPNWADELMWVWSIEGGESWPTTMTSRHEREDDFTITLRFRSAAPDTERLDLMERCERYMNAVGYVVGDGCHLQDQVDGLGEITTGNKSGPYSTPSATGGHYEARGEIDVLCKTRIE